MNFPKELDSVVMLTWSNWHTESRKNRYHYATRFARYVPVIFVQPDLNEEVFKWEKTEIPNLEILHLSDIYNGKQRRLLQQALANKNIKNPLWWIYNCKFY